MVAAALSGLYDELLELVPAALHSEFGEVFYSGRTAFEQPSPIYLLGFNPGGDPSNAALNRYTIGYDLDASRFRNGVTGPDSRTTGACSGPGPSHSNVGSFTCFTGASAAVLELPGR
jgi:hypothetical protein